MLPQPPAGTEPAEGAAIAEHVKRCDGLGDDAWFAKGDGGDESAQPRLVSAGEHAEGDPRLGYRLPGTVHLGNLDQMIHQCEAVEADLDQLSAPGLAASRQDRIPARETATPGARLLVSCPDHDHDEESAARFVASDALCCSMISVWSQPVMSTVEQSFDLSQLIGEDRRRDWSVALYCARGTARPLCS